MTMEITKIDDSRLCVVERTTNERLISKKNIEEQKANLQAQIAKLDEMLAYFTE